MKHEEFVKKVYGSEIGDPNSREGYLGDGKRGYKSAGVRGGSIKLTWFASLLIMA